MDWLEHELKQALAREEPPAGFDTRLRRRLQRRVPRWLAVAAAIAALAGGAAESYRRHRGQAAREQVMLAMRIAAGKLNQVQVHLRENTR
jgi:hypothetical protein